MLALKETEFLQEKWCAAICGVSWLRVFSGELFEVCYGHMVGKPYIVVGKEEFEPCIVHLAGGHCKYNRLSMPLPYGNCCFLVGTEVNVVAITLFEGPWLK